MEAVETVFPRPVGLDPVPGESTGSFVRRLAHVNAVPVAEVLSEVGVRGQPRDLEPRACEVFLHAHAVDRLAVMAWQSPQVLRRALPTLGEAAGCSTRQLVRVVPWPTQWTVLEACALCVAGREDASVPVVLASGERWQVCVRHGRWLRVPNGGGPAQVSLAGLESVVRAHRRWLRLRQRVGPYARALLADAVQVSACWWQSRQMGAETVWAQRERLVGVQRQQWSVPLVVYPEAVVVAEAMAVYERQRRWNRDFGNGAPGWVSRRWIEFVGQRLGMPDQIRRGGYRVLREWTLLHRVTAPVAVRLAQEPPPSDYLSRRLEPMDPHRALPARGALEDASCLEWRLGRPVSDLG
ncbi:TniQ family protein [Streptomyces sp. NPDC047886]|uniref:TniQ family protein n=1 Tax=Streptomyces sp. NPDC047886 TaxID=3365490 RepID=UPI0037249E28